MLRLPHRFKVPAQFPTRKFFLKRHPFLQRQNLLGRTGLSRPWLQGRFPPWEEANSRPGSPHSKKRTLLAPKLQHFALFNIPAKYRPNSQRGNSSRNGTIPTQGALQGQIGYTANLKGPTTPALLPVESPFLLRITTCPLRLGIAGKRDSAWPLRATRIGSWRTAVPLRPQSEIPISPT